MIKYIINLVQIFGKILIIDTEILRQYFINHPQSIDKYTFLQNSAFTHWVKENYSPHKGNSAVKIPDVHWRLSSSYQMFS